MKMETVIRSPHDGVVKKLAHKEGVSAHSLAALLPRQEMIDAVN